MNYQEFILFMMEQTNQLLKPEACAEIHTALKNNNTRRTGLTIVQEGTNISPTIYLEEYYQQYQNGRALSDIVQSLVNLYQEVKFEHSWEISQVQNFQFAKSQIAYKLIHLEKNQTLLGDIPFIPHLDLAIVFFLLLETTEKGSATILITNDMLDYWGVSLEHIYCLATENTPRLLHANFSPICEVIQELLPKKLREEYIPEDNHLYVLSNQHRHFGAACILYNHMLENIAQELDDDFYVLPSSIHETIILPASHSLTKEALDAMVVEINETQVAEEEILSDHAYYYSRNERKLLLH